MDGAGGGAVEDGGGGGGGDSAETGSERSSLGVADEMGETS